MEEPEVQAQAIQTLDLVDLAAAAAETMAVIPAAAAVTRAVAVRAMAVRAPVVEADLLLPTGLAVWPPEMVSMATAAALVANPFKT
jgi:hypothetical protein